MAVAADRWYRWYRSAGAWGVGAVPNGRSTVAGPTGRQRPPANGKTHDSRCRFEARSLWLDDVRSLLPFLSEPPLLAVVETVSVALFPR